DKRSGGCKRQRRPPIVETETEKCRRKTASPDHRNEKGREEHDDDRAQDKIHCEKVRKTRKHAQRQGVEREKSKRRDDYRTDSDAITRKFRLLLKARDMIFE